MGRGIPVALVPLVALTLLAGPASAAVARPEKKNPRLKVVKVYSSAERTGAIATGTATCPKTERSDLGPWRAISGGFTLWGVLPGSVPPGFGPPPPPTGSGVVYESRKVGQRSWRISAQSISGTFTLEAAVYCQNEVPKTTHTSATVATPGISEVGPATVAHCRNGKTVSGGFSTPPPYTAAGTSNIVIAALPSGKKGWEAQVLSNQASSLTSYIYCASRKGVRVRHSSAGEPTSVATLDLTEALANIYDCPQGRFLPGGGGFSEEGMTTSQYMIPVSSHQQSSGLGWHVDGIKVGSGVPVTLRAHQVCG